MPMGWIHIFDQVRVRNCVEKVRFSCIGQIFKVGLEIFGGIPPVVYVAIVRKLWMDGA